MTRSVLILLIFVVAFIGTTSVFGQEKRVKAYGAYMNIKTHGEHAEGYWLDLWQQGNKIIGIIRVQEGLAGDPPAGILEDVKYNARTHRISFTAKYSSGTFFDKTHDGVDAQDVLSFSGQLTTQSLRGVLKSKNLLCADKCRQRHTINLRRSRANTRSMSVYDTYAAWQDGMKDIMETYGPKW